MGAKVSNPRKKFNWSIRFVGHPCNAYLFQKVTIPERTVEEVEHGDVNRKVKTAGQVSFGHLIADKLETTSGSDTWLHDWIESIQSARAGGGLIPNQYWAKAIISELAEDGQSILNQWTAEEVWPCKVNGQDLDRMSSENSIEGMEFSVGFCYKQ